MINKLTVSRWLIAPILVLFLSLTSFLAFTLPSTTNQSPHTHYFVSPDGNDDENSGLAPDMPFASIQHALELAQPGDSIHLAPETFYQDVQTVRSGTPDAPIRITGTSESIVRGSGGDRIFQVFHDHIVLEGFTIDGRDETADEEQYRKKLLYAVGREERNGVEGLRILSMTFRNADEECVRLRYFAQYNEIAYSRFENCGLWDFQLGGSGKVGEALYIGTSSEQWDRNPTHEPDESAFNWVHHNRFVTNGNECVEMKEGTHDNIVEHNICSNQQDPDSGGIVSRGNHNIIRYNEIYENVGAGIRLGGHRENGTQYGINNIVYGNRIYNNQAGGIKFEAAEQHLLCGNQIDGNEDGSTVGEHGDAFEAGTVCDEQTIQDMPETPF